MIREMRCIMSRYFSVIIFCIRVVFFLLFCRSNERNQRSRFHERGSSAERRYKRSHRRSPTSSVHRRHHHRHHSHHRRPREQREHHRHRHRHSSPDRTEEKSPYVTNHVSKLRSNLNNFYHCNFVHALESRRKVRREEFVSNAIFCCRCITINERRSKCTIASNITLNRAPFFFFFFFHSRTHVIMTKSAQMKRVLTWGATKSIIFFVRNEFYRRC